MMPHAKEAAFEFVLRVEEARLAAGDAVISDDVTYNCFTSRLPEPLREEVKRIKRTNLTRRLTWGDIVALARDS
jgi:hypothetical protein